MKFILTVLGIVLLAMAGVYFSMPADQLPELLSGHEDGRDPLARQARHRLGCGGSGADRGKHVGGAQMIGEPTPTGIDGVAFPEERAK